MRDGIAIGSRWADRDPRESGRIIEVTDLDVRYAYCVSVQAAGRLPASETGRRVRVLRANLLRRFRRAEGAQQ